MTAPMAGSAADVAGLDRETLEGDLQSLMSTRTGRAYLYGAMLQTLAYMSQECAGRILVKTLREGVEDYPARPAEMADAFPMCLGCGLGGPGVSLDDRELCAVCRLVCARCGIWAAVLPEDREHEIDSMATHGACVRCLDEVERIGA